MIIYQLPHTTHQAPTAMSYFFAVAAAAILSTVMLGFGISSAVITGQNNDAVGECGPAIWINLLVWTILDFLLWIILFGAACIIADSNDSNDTNAEKFAGGGGASFGVFIWSCVIIFNTSDGCREHFENVFPQLWSMVYAHVILYFVLLGCVGVGILFGLLFAMCHCVYKIYDHMRDRADDKRIRKANEAERAANHKARCVASAKRDGRALAERQAVERQSTIDRARAAQHSMV